MMPNRKDDQVGDVVTGPWTNTPAEPVEPVEGELVEREPVEAPTRRLESPGEAGTGATGPVAAVRPGRPLTVEQAGGRYQYVTSLAAAGVRRIPSSLLDGVLNRVKLAHLREGGTHRGEILPAQRNVYETEMRERRDRRRKFGVALFVRKTRTTSHSLSGKHVRDAHRPRWETVAPVGAEVANLTWPHTPILSPLVNGVNGVVAEATGAVVGAVGDGISAAAMSTPGAAAMALGAAGVVAWQARNEHHDRTNKLIELMSASGNGDLMPDNQADVITAAMRAANILKTPTGNMPGQRIELTAQPADDGESWTARVLLPEGVTTAAVRKRLPQLASALDRSLPQVALIDGESERRCTLRAWHGSALPFTGAPTSSPLVAAQAVRLDQGIPVGLDADRRPVSLHLGKGRHGLVVASSGNGKTVLLQGIAAATVLDPSGKLTVLDGKPDGAYVPFEPVCTHYATTASATFEERGAEVLEAVADDMDDRLARAENGEELEGDHVVILDEFQEWTGSANGAGQKVGEPRYRMRAALERIARRGRSARVRLVLASQQYDGRTLDQGVLANIGWRSIGYCPSSMSKDALGENAERYGLDTSSMFVDEMQAGASVITGGGVHPYRAQRSYLLTSDDIARVVARGIELRGGPVEQAPTLRTVDDDQAPVTAGEVIELGEVEQQILAAAAEVYAADDAEWIKVSELYTEVVEGELGWTVDKAMQMTISSAMKEGEVEKRTEQVTLPSGSKTRFVYYRRADIVATGQRLGRAA